MIVEITVRAYVHELKGKVPEAFIPLVFQPGDAIQINWGEATIYLDGTKRTVYLFCARLCYNDAAFVIAYRRQNGESFLDALIQTSQSGLGMPLRRSGEVAQIFAGAWLKNSLTFTAD